VDFWVDSRVVDEDFAARVRDFLDEAYPAELRASRFERPFDWTFHKSFIAWQKENLPDATPAQRAAFREEVDRFGIELTNLSSTNLVSRTIEAVGTDEQKSTYMAAFDDGDARCSLGYTEPDSGSDVAAAKTRAIRDGDEWVINGQKMFTSHADESTHVFLLTRTNTEVPKHEGLTMFLVPLDAPGVEVRPVETLGYHRTCMTFYFDVRVPDSARVGNVDMGWSVMRVALDLEHGAGNSRLDTRSPNKAGSPTDAPASREGPRLGHGSKQVGKLVTHTASWAQHARRPDGTRPIDDPIVRERLARLAVEDELGRLIARRNDAIRSKPGVGNGSKLWWSELYLRASVECMDIVGAEGMLPYTDTAAIEDGWIEAGFRGAPVTTIAGGASEIQRDVIAERRLGLPKSRPKR
jgi:alkylation response protein AidB-like acyl-CoA dehydrogenase